MDKAMAFGIYASQTKTNLMPTYRKKITLT